MAWSLYQKTGEEKDKFLEPVKFSNGKTQEDVVNEVLDYIEKGEKVIFIRGVCGTGKSAISLNIAKELGSGSVVVPIKNLQEQYKSDYQGQENNDNRNKKKGKYVLKDDNEKLDISVITGRNNHKCKFIEDGSLSDVKDKTKKDSNSKLNEVLSAMKEKDSNSLNSEKENSKNPEDNADRYDLPCKIELKEKNSEKIMEYLKQNKHVNQKNFQTMSDVKRVSVAMACPYWCPVLPERYSLKHFSEDNKTTYEGLEGERFVVHEGVNGCSFYEQYKSYSNSDVIVFNSLKYKLESLINRKPKTDVEIIDECDEFLDSFSNQRELNVDRLQNALIYVLNNEEKVENSVKEMSAILKHLKQDKNVEESVYTDKIIPLKKTGIYDVLKYLLGTPEIFDEMDEENYLFDVEETAQMFKDFLEETYVSFNKKNDQLTASLVTTNLAKKFQELKNKNKALVLMSGTIHSEAVLKNVFGLEEFKIIDAETQSQGQIEIVKTGLEEDCRYGNFKNGKHNREDYLKALNESVKKSKKPTLVHVNSFQDLPKEEEIEKLDLGELVSSENLRELQRVYKKGEMIEEFKSGKRNVLFSTRASRGMDFPGEQCNSIIFTKYPNPNVKDSFWKILQQTRPHFYWMFYKDKASRELLQKIYRGLRSKNDKVQLLSPDTRILEAFEESDSSNSSGRNEE